MDKISGIVPASSRITSVNLRDSQTMRPGAPSFGAPVGKAAINGGNLPTTAEKAVAAHNALMSRRSGDAHKPEIIRDMANRFFMQNKTEAGGVVDDVDVNFQMDIGPTSVPATDVGVIDVPQSTLEVQSYEAAGDSSEPEWMIAESSVDESEYTPPGSYLDVSV